MEGLWIEFGVNKSNREARGNKRNPRTLDGQVYPGGKVLDKFWIDFVRILFEKCLIWIDFTGEAKIMLNEEKLIGIMELAERLEPKLGYKPHNHTLHKAIKRGLPCVPDRLKGRGFRFYLSEVVVWLSTPQETDTTPNPTKRGPGRPRKTPTLTHA